MTDPNPAEARLAELLEKAWPRPWRMLHEGENPGLRVTLNGIEVQLTRPAGRECDCGQVWADSVDWCVADCDTRQMGEGPNGEARMANAALIAAAVNALPSLLAELQRLRASEAGRWRPDREAVARLIDSAAFDPNTAFESMLLPEQVEGELRNRRKRALAKADAILALPPPIARWRPISEAPRDGTPVDLWGSYGHGPAFRMTDYGWHEGRWLNADGEDASDYPKYIFQPTHFQPLPPPPPPEER